MTHLIERFTEFLKHGKYNPATIAAYRQVIFVFYNHFRDIPQSKFTDELVNQYLLDLKGQKNPKYDSVQTTKAIKLFFEIIFSRKIKLNLIHQKEEHFVDILSQEEVNNIFEAAKNLKHKLLLMLVYNSGLKINEVINLEINDLNFEENTLTIRNKGKKSRKLRLSPNLNSYFKEYLYKYNPTKILFTGSNSESYYSARNIQMFFQKILSEAGIHKEATLNTLRHSFAVHSLEMGLDLHILQKILGHNNIQTTTIYSHLANPIIEKIRNPLENIKV